jgi:hypothetical protein
MTAGQPTENGGGLPCEELLVRSRPITPGVAAHRDNARLALHNHENPCAAAQQIEDPAVRKLGAEEAARPGLKKLCDRCSFPDGADAALRRTPRKYR